MTPLTNETLMWLSGSPVQNTMSSEVEQFTNEGVALNRGTSGVSCVATNDESPEAAARYVMRLKFLLEDGSGRIWRGGDELLHQLEAGWRQMRFSKASLEHWLPQYSDGVSNSWLSLLLPAAN